MEVSSNSVAELIAFDPDEQQALGFDGEPSYLRFEDLHRLLSDRLGRQHARLFAAPALDAEGRLTGWNAQGGGNAIRLKINGGAPVEELARLVADIEGFIKELSATGRAEDRRAARFLADTLQIPDENFLFEINGRPVLAGWAFTSGKRGIVAQFLKKAGSAPQQRRVGPLTDVKVLEPVTPQKNWAVPLLCSFAGFLFMGFLAWLLIGDGLKLLGFQDGLGGAELSLQVGQCWKRSTVTGEAGNRRLLTLQVCGLQDGAQLNIMEAGQQTCSVDMKIDHRDGKEIFSTSSAINCQYSAELSALNLTCSPPEGERMACDFTWTGKRHTAMEFVKLEQETPS